MVYVMFMYNIMYNYKNYSPGIEELKFTFDFLIFFLNLSHAQYYS